MEGIGEGASVKQTSPLVRQVGCAATGEGHREVERRLRAELTAVRRQLAECQEQIRQLKQAAQGSKPPLPAYPLLPSVPRASATVSSPVAPSLARQASLAMVQPTNLPDDARSEQELQQVAALMNKQAEYDVYLASHPRECSGCTVVEHVEASLKENGLSVKLSHLENEASNTVSAPSLSHTSRYSALAASANFVFLLTPNCFAESNLPALLDFREAIRLHIPVILITVEGSRWLVGGHAHDFPPYEVIPPELRVALDNKAIDHSSEYYIEFIDRVVERIKRNRTLKCESGKVAAEPQAASPSPKPADLEKTFDFFLSHKRSEAQDFCRGLRESLLNESYSTFLDQEDDSVLSSLLQSVGQSRCLVFVLSASIFQSEWCLKELQAAMEYGNQIILVKYQGFDYSQEEIEDLIANCRSQQKDALRELFSPANLPAITIQYNRNYHDAFVNRLRAAVGTSLRQQREWPKALDELGETGKNLKYRDDLMKQQGSWTFALHVLTEAMQPARDLKKSAACCCEWMAARLKESAEDPALIRFLAAEKHRSVIQGFLSACQRRVIRGMPMSVWQKLFRALVQLGTKKLQLQFDFTRSWQFADEFNEPLSSWQWEWPVEELRFGSALNQPVDKLTLPASLTQLSLGDKFNQPVEKLSLPASLTELTLGLGFNHPVDKLSLPPSVRQLTVYGCTVSADSVVWDEVKELTFGRWFNQPVEKLSLPASLTQLTFGSGFDQPVDKLSLPESLTQLDFGTSFDQPVDKLSLPSSLIQLTFSDQFDQPVDMLSLPASLIQLTFGHRFDQPVDKLSLSASLQALTFGQKFNQSIAKLRLPASLTHLCFGHEFNQPLDALKFPPSLQHLTIGCPLRWVNKWASQFGHPIDGLTLPPSLVSFRIGERVIR